MISYLPVLAVVLRLEVEGVLLYLRVPEGLQDAATVSSQKVVRHVGVEVEVVRVVQEIPGQRPSGFPKI